VNELKKLDGVTKWTNCFSSVTQVQAQKCQTKVCREGQTLVSLVQITSANRSTCWNIVVWRHDF